MSHISHVRQTSGFLLSHINLSGTAKGWGPPKVILCGLSGVLRFSHPLCFCLFYISKQMFSLAAFLGFHALSQGCADPDLQGCNPAKFSVLPGRKYFSYYFSWGIPGESFGCSGGSHYFAGCLFSLPLEQNMLMLHPFNGSAGHNKGLLSQGKGGGRLQLRETKEQTRTKLEQGLGRANSFFNRFEWPNTLWSPPLSLPLQADTHARGWGGSLGNGHSSFQSLRNQDQQSFRRLVASALFYAGEGDGQPYICGTEVEAEQAPGNHGQSITWYHQSQFSFTPVSSSTQLWGSNSVTSCFKPQKNPYLSVCDFKTWCKKLWLFLEMNKSIICPCDIWKRSV